MPTRIFFLLGFLGWFGFGSSTDTADTSDTSDTANTADTAGTTMPSDTADSAEMQALEEPIMEDVPHLFLDRERPILLHSLPENLSGVDASNCISCHMDITKQWKTSAHRNAQRNSHYQEKLAEHANAPLCSQCHAPLQLQHHQLPSSYVDGTPLKPIFEDNPNWDAVLASESVGCASCHIRDGKILGIEANENAPHNITVSTELSSSQSCADCHQFSWEALPFPMYNTFAEWQSSPQAKANIQCQDCHMPPQATSNAFTSPLQSSHHFQQSTEQALAIVVDLPSPKLSRAQDIPVHILLRNIGAAHSIPTGNPWKQYTLVLTITNTKGKDLIKPQEHILGWIQDKEGVWTEDLRIPAGGSKRIDYTINISAKKRSGDAMLKLTLHKSKEEKILLWDIPVTVQ